MADLTFTIPDEYLGDVIEAMAFNYGYQDNVIDENGSIIPNPQTKVQFAKTTIRNIIRNAYIMYKEHEGVVSLKQSIIDTATSNASNFCCDSNSTEV